MSTLSLSKRRMGVFYLSRKPGTVQRFPANCSRRAGALTYVGVVVVAQAVMAGLSGPCLGRGHQRTFEEVYKRGNDFNFE